MLLRRVIVSRLCIRIRVLIKIVIMVLRMIIDSWIVISFSLRFRFMRYRFCSRRSLLGHRRCCSCWRIHSSISLLVRASSFFFILLLFIMSIVLHVWIHIFIIRFLDRSIMLCQIILDPFLLLLFDLLISNFLFFFILTSYFISCLECTAPKL